ncbi:hypothetical protein [Prodigiosinella confusarubida]|uniref:hypothetical protein n=1 Tax=Serratia sp. (strain ATCC 39006) TaxID=104623 RepID=UPI001AEFF057|nr:hypothetical protein [Serratia sp. ATCC 39006]
MTPEPAPPGTAATPWKPRKERDADSRASLRAVRHTAPQSPTPAASRSPLWRKTATRPLPNRRRHNVRYAWAAFSGFRVMPHYVE